MQLERSAGMKAELKDEESFESVRLFLGNNFSSPTHWPEWNLAVSRHYNTRFRYLVAEQDGLVRGICPVHEVRGGMKTTFHSGQFHYIPYGGWITDITAVPAKIDYRLPVNSRFECFSLPRSGIFGMEEPYSGRVFDTLVNDLSREEEEIWSSSIDSKRRNMIRKAERSGITVSSGEAVFSDFNTLYRDSLNRNGMTGLPEEFLREMTGLTGDVRFVPFVAYSNGIPCGVLGLVYDKDYAIYWLGASSVNSPGQGQGELLQWEAIRFSRVMGCRYYDLCYIDREKLPHIYEFKKGFSKQEARILYFNRKSLLYRVLNKLQVK